MAQPYGQIVKFSFICAVVTALLSGCDSSSDNVRKPQKGSNFVAGEGQSGDADGKLFQDSDGLFGDQSDEGLFGAISKPREDGSSEIVYPELEFDGTGFATCKGDTYPTTAGVMTTVDDDVLDIQMFRNHVSVGSKGQGKADSQLAAARGHTYYKRTEKEQLNELKGEGFDVARYAIFADGVEKEAQRQNYEFDKPLPVYPWPGPLSRYSDLDAGPKSWTSQVSGHRSFTATIKVTKLSGSESKIRLKFELSIAQDSKREYYEDFPVPREAIYEIDPENKDVRRIESTSWFYGNENCGGRAEEVRMTYKLCKKTTGDKVDDMSCR